MNFYEWAGRKHFVSLNLTARVGFEPAISDFQAGSFNHCTRTISGLIVEDDTYYGQTLTSVLNQFVTYNGTCRASHIYLILIVHADSCNPTDTFLYNVTEKCLHYLFY